MGQPPPNREAVGKVVNSLVPVNTEGQPALPFLPQIAP